MDSITAANLMGEVFRVVREFPVAYNSRRKVYDMIVERLSDRHQIDVMPDGSLLIDRARFVLYRRGRCSTYDFHCYD